MASIRIVLSIAAVNDMELFGWDCKTAFLHAQLCQDIYIWQIPGYPLSDPSLVLKLNIALYSLCQAAYKFYQPILAVMNGIGMQRSEVDHAFFYGSWTTPPDPSIPMPRLGKLQLFVPIHVDDGLMASTNKELYSWFLTQLQRCLTIIDLGPAQLYLGCRIICDCSKQMIYLLQEAFIRELLDEYSMTEAPLLSRPVKIQLSEMKNPPLGALPSISDDDLKVKFQSLVRSLLSLPLFALSLETAKLRLRVLCRIVLQRDGCRSWSLNLVWHAVAWLAHLRQVQSGAEVWEYAPPGTKANPVMLTTHYGVPGRLLCPRQIIADDHTPPVTP